MTKTGEHESDSDTNCTCSQYSQQRIGTRIEVLENKRASFDLPNYGFVKIGQNTEKSPGDLKKLVVTQTPVKTID